MDKAINSPFRYAGGKFYARNLILQHVPAHKMYIEPFTGGGSIFFAKAKAKNNWLNDLDETLVNVYLHIQNSPEELIAALKGEIATKERHNWYKNIFKPANNLERAQRWYYLNRTSYSGIMNMQNCYWGYGDKYSMRPENWGASILRTSEKLKDVRFTSFDFEKVIDDAPDNAFLFIDPPYYNADQDKFYTCSFSLDDHIRLCKKLKEHSHRLKFMITYDNSKEVWDLYDWAVEIHEKEWNYTISRTDDQKKTSDKTQSITKGARGKGKEIFILNYSDSSVKQLEIPTLEHV